MKGQCKALEGTRGSPTMQGPFWAWWEEGRHVGRSLPCSGGEGGPWWRGLRMYWMLRRVPCRTVSPSRCGHCPAISSCSHPGISKYDHTANRTETLTCLYLQVLIRLCESAWAAKTSTADGRLTPDLSRRAGGWKSQAQQTRQGPPEGFIQQNHLCKTPVSEHCHILRNWGLGLHSVNLGRQDSACGTDLGHFSPDLKATT